MIVLEDERWGCVMKRKRDILVEGWGDERWRGEMDLSMH